MNNWPETLTNLRQAGSKLAQENPTVAAAYRGLNEAVNGGSVLDAKTRELIALAVAVTTRCDGCISSHAAAARKAGVTEAELAEALGTAIALNAGAAYVYSTRALEAFGQF
ncbi:carboxymuconolactone decarboxylase family protein [Bordetella sp. 15P40C-2]|uniref:carboxymuconolactone decarboxylase family protein n=1 Tax=Bordetella sp. 15P40C-2 TaxID=2572246 RepID=UPI00132A108B|nr:carboxymuconolactone decarboxylase family protein [Bordetella sp. 15P40C-2]MVW72733.1 carboxymuconolactone decarboxylase family protein [Bordetella sp. 15P40C-2]